MPTIGSPWSSNGTFGGAPRNFDVPANTIYDPLTRRWVGLGGLREGAEAGSATVAHGFAMDQQAARNRALALRTLQGGLTNPLYTQLEQTALAELRSPTSAFDEDLIRRIFARRADAAGSEARNLSRTIASSLGGRGISASSPLAAGLASQIQTQKAGALRGAQADIAIAKLQSDVQQRALAFQQALAVQQQRQALERDIASVQGAAPSAFGYDSLQGLTELVIERHAQDQARKDAKDSSRNQLISSIITGALGFGAALI